MIKSNKWNLSAAKYAINEIQETASNEFDCKLNKEQLQKAIVIFDDLCIKQYPIHRTAFLAVIHLENDGLI